MTRPEAQNKDKKAGIAAFDEAFIIQGDDASKVKHLFSNPKIRQLVAAQAEIEFSVKEKKTVNIPIWAGVGAIVAGGVLLVLGGKKG